VRPVLKGKSTWRRGALDERGFTLVELLTFMLIGSLLMGLSYLGVRDYWLQRSLTGARDQVVTQLRRQHQRAVAETHPLIYGARFRLNSSDWGLIQYNPRDPSTIDDDTCAEVATRTFDVGVVVTAPTSFQAAEGVTSFCATNLRRRAARAPSDACNPGNSANWGVQCPTIAVTDADRFAFFFARGDATAGQVTVRQPRRNRSLAVSVAGLTGRVEEL